MTGGFGRAVRTEWTKLRTVPGWVLALLAAAAAVVGLALTPGQGGSCGRQGPNSACRLPVGPDGEEVSDTFFFVRQGLDGDGSITVRVSAVAGELTGDSGPRPGLAPWAKTGLIMKAGTAAGSAYAAVMVTGAHGVRMQSDFTGDIAGPSGTAPRWLRLTRSGETITGAASTDGDAWTTIGTVRLAGLPATVQAGMFATSPQYTAAVTVGGLGGAESSPSRVTGTFDALTRQGRWTGPQWTGSQLGGADNAGPFERGGYRPTPTGFTVTGSGDIAPAVSGAAGLGVPLTQTLVGTFAGLIAVVAVGALFITAEYRRGLIRTTLTAQPRRGRALASKAVVVGAVAFGAGLASATAALVLGRKVLVANGAYVNAASRLTEVRLIAGTAVLLAVASVLALAIGAILRRSAAAVATAVVVIVLPYLLSVSVLPIGAARWLLRVSPAAAFAAQQSAVQYAQVDNVYAPADGYFPLPWWAGVGVLCLWAAVAFTVALVLLRRREA